MTYALNSPKRIMSIVSLNTKFRWVKRDQVRKNSGEQVISIPMWTFKQFQKYKTTQIIEYRFIRHVIYKQCVPSMAARKFGMENWLFRMSNKKMIIFLARLLSRSLKKSKEICVLKEICQDIYQCCDVVQHTKYKLSNWTKQLVKKIF